MLHKKLFLNNIVNHNSVLHTQIQISKHTYRQLREEFKSLKIFSIKHD